jgi:hypothetical protein
MVALCSKLRTSALADSLLRVSCIIFSSLAQSPPLAPFLPFAASRRAQFQFWAKILALELLQVSDSSICSETSDLATPIIQEVLFQVYFTSFGSGNELSPLAQRCILYCSFHLQFTRVKST